MLIVIMEAIIAIPFPMMMLGIAEHKSGEDVITKRCLGHGVKSTRAQLAV